MNVCSRTWKPATSPFVFVCDLLGFGQPDGTSFVQIATEHLGSFLGPRTGPQRFDSTGGLIFGVVDAFGRDFTHVASFATAKGALHHGQIFRFRIQPSQSVGWLGSRTMKS